MSNDSNIFYNAMMSNVHELTNVGDLIEHLKSYNKKIKLSLTEVLFEDGLTDQLMSMEYLINHLQRLDSNTTIMVKKKFWDNKCLLSLNIIKVIQIDDYDERIKEVKEKMKEEEYKEYLKRLDIEIKEEIEKTKGRLDYINNRPNIWKRIKRIFGKRN